MVTAAIILAAYLWGAIPSAYLVGRYFKGIDIRDYGSGNVGASNLMEHVGKWTGLLLGSFDAVAKGTLPVVAAKLLDQSVAVQAGVGLAAIAGHNWSPYIRFTGGRGVATVMGVMLGFLMWREMLVGALLIGIIGKRLTHESAFWSLVAVLTLPLQASLFGQPPELVYMSIGITLLLASKRLTANWEPPRSTQHSLPKVLAYRLLWDRDVPRREGWTGRRPPVEGQR